MNLSYLNNLLEIIQSEIMGVGSETKNMEIMKQKMETKDNSSIFLKPQSVNHFRCSVASYSLQPHELQHARPLCPSPIPGVHSNSCPLSWWCHPAISSSVVPFSSCPQSLPASESFPMSQHFTWGGQSTGVSALASFLPKKSQGWSPCSPRDSQESSPTPQFKSINSVLSRLHSPTLTSIHD